MDFIDEVIAQSLSFPIPFNNSYIFPSNCFGVFVTIRRSKQDQLIQWPQDVHGCIGNWNPTFQPLTPNEIQQMTFQVAKEAFYHDSRRYEFSREFFEDPHLTVEIDFLLLPLTEIIHGKLKNTNEPFHNDKYGFIYQGQFRHATYLPNVFPPDTSWSTIQQSIQNKAGNYTDGKYYAYPIQQISKTLWEFWKNSYGITMRNQFLTSMSQWIDQTTWIPYQVTSTLVQSNPHEDVRNVATLLDIGNYMDKSQKEFPHLKEKWKEYVQYYQEHWKELSPQALSFLIQIPQLLEKEEMKQVLQKRLESKYINRAFEWGEIILGLGKNPSNQQLLQSGKNLGNQIDDVFQLNWDSQVIGQGRNKTNETIVKIYVEAWKRWWKTVSIYQREDIESNYLVVAIEGMSSLNVQELESKIYTLVYQLAQSGRWKSNGLIVFRDGKEARIDISCHLYNSI